jgi:hypothetical protein
VHGAEPDVAEADLVAVPERGAVEAVLPVGVPLVRQVEAGAGARGELARAGLVVGVDVGLGDGGDAQAVPGGEAMKVSTSRRASTTTASPVAWQPIR